MELYFINLDFPEVAGFHFPFGGPATWPEIISIGSTHLPFIQHSSHHHNYYMFLVANPELNLHLWYSLRHKKQKHLLGCAIPKRKACLPTIHFADAFAVSFREGSRKWTLWIYLPPNKKHPQDRYVFRKESRIPMNLHLWPFAGWGGEPK